MFAVAVLIESRYEGCESITLCCRWLACLTCKSTSLSRLCVPVLDLTFICHVNYGLAQCKNSPGVINQEICTACRDGLCPPYWRRKCIQHYPGPFMLRFLYCLNFTIPDFFRLFSHASSFCLAICLTCLFLAWWPSLHFSLHVFHNQSSKNKNDKWTFTECYYISDILQISNSKLSNSQ